MFEWPSADFSSVEVKNDIDPTLEQSRWLIQRILGLMAGMAAAGSSDKAADFRAELATLSKQIVEPVAGENIDAPTRRCLALCQDFFQDGDTYRVNNEKTYAEIIDLLRDALRSLSDEASLDGLVVTSTARFRDMVEIEDVFELKKKMTQEIQDLERSVNDFKTRREQEIKGLSERTRVLEQRLTRTRERLSLTLAESSLDPLTRLANRRYFDVQLASWMEPHSREHPFVLAMFDIDDFKKINDAHGHQVGDRVLRGIARSLRQVTRDEDVLARYGGEEFVLLLRNFSADKARERCDEILKSVEGQAFDWEDPQRRLKVHATVSCGMTEFSPGDSVYDLLRRADTALYQAKRLGKNRIEIKRQRMTAGTGAPLQRL